MHITIKRYFLNLKFIEKVTPLSDISNILSSVHVLRKAKVQSTTRQNRIIVPKCFRQVLDTYRHPCSHLNTDKSFHFVILIKKVTSRLPVGLKSSGRIPIPSFVGR